MHKEKSYTGVLADLSLIIGDYIFTGNEEEVRFCCPFCSKRVGKKDTKYHLYFNTGKRVWNCFRCGDKGHISRFLDESEIEEDVSWEVLEKVLEDVTPGAKEEVREGDRIRLPEGLEPIRDGTDAAIYLEKRGVSIQDSLFYNLKCGCYDHGVERKRGTPRIFVPTYWGSKLVYWVARKYNTLSDAPKYLNPRSSQTSQNYIFNLDKVDSNYPIIITEGVFSGMACGRNGVSLFGKVATKSQFRLLRDLECPEFVVALDGDAMRESIILCKSLFDVGKDVSLVTFPEDEDPDSVANLDFFLDNRKRIEIETLVEMKMGVLS